MVSKKLKDAERQPFLYSEAHRHDCEVRDIAKMPLKTRRAYLAGVDIKRSQPAGDRLRDGLRKLWDDRKDKSEGIKQ